MAAHYLENHSMPIFLHPHISRFLASWNLESLEHDFLVSDQQGHFLPQVLDFLLPAVAAIRQGHEMNIRLS
jgi:hypothetical protein